MKVLSVSLVFFCLFYFTLRYLKLFWEKRQLPAWTQYPLGVFAWAALLSLIGIVWGLAQPVIQLFTAPDMGLAFLLMGLAMAVGMIAKYAHANPELLDFDSMKAFLKDSLAFANPSRSWMNLSEELDKHEVKRVYKEVTGNDLPDEDERYEHDLKKKLDAAKPNAFSKDNRVRSPKEALDLLNRPIESPHLHLELRELEEGKRVDISDSWQMNRLKRSSHEFFRHVKHVTIDPAERIMRIELQSEGFTAYQLKDDPSLFRVKQTLYDFLQALHQQDWVQPYLTGVDHFSCTYSHYEDEAFRGIMITPLCRVEIERSVLRTYTGRFFNVQEMKTEVLI